MRFAACFRTSWHSMRWSIACFMLLCGLPGWSADSTDTVPDSDDPEQTGLTRGQAYRIAIRPQAGSVPVAKMHNWIVHVETASGDTFVPEQLVFMAGMPVHGHGLPSAPRVTQQLDNGDYLVEGIKFNMTGLWHLVVNVNGPSGPDTVRFEMNLRNPPIEIEDTPDDWTVDELRAIKSLWINTLQHASKDSSNRLSGNPDAIELGRKFFFDRGLSASGAISCAHCHDPDKYFADGRTLSFGTRQTARHSPSLLGVAHSQWFYWDGRRDSLWAQAVTPIETPGEMDNTRVDAVRYVISKDEYRDLFTELSNVPEIHDMADVNRFPVGAGPYSDAQAKQNWQRMSESDRRAVGRAFSDIGKMIAAYVETLQHGQARFDEFAESLLRGDQRAAHKMMSRAEREGLKLFLDLNRVPCLRCHNGPLFSNQEFHNVATGFAADGSLDFGRYIGLQAARVDEFNCRGQYSDTARENCELLIHAVEGHMDQGAFKVPSLRNISVTGPYMHDGRFEKLDEVVEHYRNAPDKLEIPHEVPPFTLSDREASQLAAFLGTLTGADE